MSVSPLSPSSTGRDLNLFPRSDVEPSQRRHSMPNEMTHIRESPSSEDVEIGAKDLDVVDAAAVTDIPPDSPRHSVFVAY